jgi:hypothetical protein
MLQGRQIQQAAYPKLGISSRAELPALV